MWPDLGVCVREGKKHKTFDMYGGWARDRAGKREKGSSAVVVSGLRGYSCFRFLFYLFVCSQFSVITIANID